MEKIYDLIILGGGPASMSAGIYAMQTKLDTLLIEKDEFGGQIATTSSVSNYLGFQKLSGKEHQVITGLCIISRDRCFRTSSIAKVTFAGLDQEEIETYVNSEECDDKAGAYAIQGIGGKFITHIDGDYYAIMGLPLNTVYEELKNISLY